MNSNQIIKKHLFPFLLLLCSPLLAYSFNSTSPLDSIKQVLRNLDIPYEVQENWTEALEELEGHQDSQEFKKLLASLDRKIKAYLSGNDSFEREQPKKKKLKEQFQKIKKSVSQGVKSAEIVAVLKLANEAEKNRNYSKAIRHYEKAVSIFEEQENWERWVEYQIKIADIKAVRLQDYDDALGILPKVKEKMRELGDGEGMRNMDTKMKNLQKKLNITAIKEAPPIILPTPSTSTLPVTTTTKPPQTPTTPDVSVINAQIKQKEEEQAKIHQDIAAQQKKEEELNRKIEAAERNNDNRAIAELERDLRNVKKKRKADIAAADKVAKELIQQKLLYAEKEAELNKKEQDTLKLYGGLAISGLLLFFTFLMYRSKKKDHKKLAIAYDELAEAQEELKVAQQKIKGLLEQQVSGAVAEELLSEYGTGITKHERRFVCVMFLDIRNFTPFVESKTPEEIIEYQNMVLGFMMEKVIEHGGIVNQIMGDGFMATFGAPVSAGNDCLQAYKAAVEIMQSVREKSRTGQIPPTKIGIGMHAGNVVAGNVGTKTRKQYSITGNTVIIAARLEQLNKEYGSSLIISREVVEQLPSAMNLPKVFDKVVVKGRKKPIEIAKYG